jgi:protein CpxP
MKKMTVLLACIIALQVTATAQRDTIRTSMPRQEQSKHPLKDELNLSKEQGKKLKVINKEFKEKTDAVRSDSTLSQTARREKMGALLKTRNEEIKKILTPEQQEKFRQHNVAQGKKRKQKSGDEKMEMEEQ